MKKIIFALAAVAALAACSKSDVAYEVNEEIGFLPVTENMTKAMMTPTFTILFYFGLYCWGDVIGRRGRLRIC